jgi:HAD superfamily hydrolase (TIGR01458 family)
MGINPNEIKGFLLDIDGVLYVRNEIVEGAVETVDFLKNHYKVAFITNTTTKTKKMIVETLINFGFDVKEDEIFSALEALKQFLISEKKGAFLLLKDSVKSEFKDIPSHHIDYVVVGDARENFTYENMNKAFRYLFNGVELIAAAKNKYFKDTDGALSLDCGAFIVGLEYATGKEARLIGKPNKDFFHLAVERLGLKPEEVAVIGDDIEADVQGAIDAGLKGILVKTGKFTPQDLKKGIQPDLVINSIKDLLNFIK